MQYPRATESHFSGIKPYIPRWSVVTTKMWVKSKKSYFATLTEIQNNNVKIFSLNLYGTYKALPL